MVQLEEFIFDKMLGQFNPFKTLNSVDDSMKLYKEEVKKDSFYEMKVFKKKIWTGGDCTDNGKQRNDFLSLFIS